MTFGIGIRALALLRRLTIAAEGIHDQLRYQNERSFPPLKSENGGRLKTVITRGKQDHGETED